MIYRRGDVYWSRFKRNGVMHRRSLGVTRKTDATRLEHVLKTRIAEGKLGMVTSPTLQEFSVQFLNFIPSRNRPETFKAYTNSIRDLLSLPALASAQLDKIDGPLFDKFVLKCREEGKAIATINLRLRVLVRALNLAREWKLLNNVPRLHRLKGENQRELIINEADEQRLIETVEHPTMKALIPFLIDTGCRIGEAVALTWADVTDNAIKIKQGKTKFARRRVPLTKRAAEILSQGRVIGEIGSPVAQEFIPSLGGLSKQGINSVFTRGRNQPISPTWATQHFVRVRRKLGLPDGLVLHSTRHTFCTRLGKAGASAFEIQRLAGHGDIQISARYAHPDTEQLERAIGRLNK